jgi:heat-inducible transcriptional repressor
MLGRNVINPLMSIEIRQGIFRDRFSKEDVIKAILKILAKETESVVFLILDNDTRYYGLSNILKYDEFKNIDKISGLVNILEDDIFLKNMAKKYAGSGVSLLIGDECGTKDLEESAMAFVKIPFWGKTEAYVGVIGSKRMDYLKVVPVLREVRAALQNSMSGWR